MLRARKQDRREVEYPWFYHRRPQKITKAIFCDDVSVLVLAFSLGQEFSFVQKFVQKPEMLKNSFVVKSSGVDQVFEKTDFAQTGGWGERTVMKNRS